MHFTYVFFETFAPLGVFNDSPSTYSEIISIHSTYL